MKHNSPTETEERLTAGLAAPARRALAGAGIHSLKQLASYREKEIASMHGIGPNALKQLRRSLEAEGLSFASEGEA